MKINWLLTGNLLFFCISFFSWSVTLYPLLHCSEGRVSIPACVLCQSDRGKLPSACMSMCVCTREGEGERERTCASVSVSHTALSERAEAVLNSLLSPHVTSPATGRNTLQTHTYTHSHTHALSISLPPSLSLAYTHTHTHRVHSAPPSHRSG